MTALPEVPRWEGWHIAERVQMFDANIAGDEFVKHADHLTAMQQQRDTALREARDAVENVPDAIFQQAAWVRHTDALAAIDALRGEA